MPGLKESRFNMWRAVVAMMHADGVVKPHEIHFVLENTRNLPLSEPQRQILAADMRHPAVIDHVFHKITDRADKEDFFHLARAIAWADGDLSDREVGILNRLQGLHLYDDDKNIMQLSLHSFEELYLGQGQQKKACGQDKTMAGMIRQIISRRAA